LSDDEPGDNSENSSLSGSAISSIEKDTKGDWLDHDPRTPTLKRFLEFREERRQQLPAHRRQNTGETLRPSDFSDLLILGHRSSPTTAMMATIQDTASEIDVPTSADHKPLPTTPGGATQEPRWLRTAPSAPQRHPAGSPLRLKKKVPWKGKNIMVLLPWDDERGQRDKAPAPMTEPEVNAMLKEWEQLGYDTTGFNLGVESLEGEGSAGQSRSPWPLGGDLDFERTQRAFRVSIPDRRGMLLFSLIISGVRGWLDIEKRLDSHPWWRLYFFYSAEIYARHEFPLICYIDRC